VLVENFQPGTLEKWGLGYDVLSAVNPRLIMVRISGYGQTGPYKDRPGFGRIGNAFGGLSFLAGYPDRAPVTPGSATIPDYMAGVYGALGTLLALQAREKTGVGQMVDIGLYEPIFRILDELAPAFAYSGYVRQRMGPGTVNVVPHSHYPTRDSRWIAIACTNDKIFKRLANAMNLPELADDDRWGRVSARVASIDEVNQLVQEWVGMRDHSDVLALCDLGDVPASLLFSVADIFEDEQYQARENIRVMPSRAGDVAVPNVIPRLSETPGALEWLGAELGGHNDEIFRDVLGMSAAEIDTLRAAGVI
jgi:crotonobetainyl-CoA:carnitine CoA-transferase CaiB-like acyl-CoA transferase